MLQGEDNFSFRGKVSAHIDRLRGNERNRIRNDSYVPTTEALQAVASNPRLAKLIVPTEGLSKWSIDEIADSLCKSDSANLVNTSLAEHSTAIHNLVAINRREACSLLDKIKNHTIGIRPTGPITKMAGGEIQTLAKPTLVGLRVGNVVYPATEIDGIEFVGAEYLPEIARRANALREMCDPYKYPQIKPEQLEEIIAIADKHQARIAGEKQTIVTAQKHLKRLSAPVQGHTTNPTDVGSMYAQAEKARAAGKDVDSHFRRADEANRAQRERERADLKQNSKGF